MNDFVDFVDFDPQTNDSLEFSTFVTFIDADPKNNKGIVPDKNKQALEDYDDETKERYRVLRLRKMDPIALIDLDPNYSFKFEYKWDPYTGERKEKDENGALWFDPDILIKHFYNKRLNKIWNKPIDDSDGYYQGYYDDGVGAGEDFHLVARGHHPEWYLFRLPIIDCYLTKSHNKQFITFGPRLTDEEIVEIERLANLRPSNYKNLFGYNRPSLSEMKNLYDTAIAQKPRCVFPQEEMSQEEILHYYNKVNRIAVDGLVKMKG